MTAAPSAPALPGCPTLKIAECYANEAPRVYRTRVLTQGVWSVRFRDTLHVRLLVETRRLFREDGVECRTSAFESVPCAALFIAINHLFKYVDPLDARLPTTVLPFCVEVL